VARNDAKGQKQIHAPPQTASLTPFAVTMPGIFLYYPGRRQVLPKLRAFIDHVKSRSNVTIKTRIQVDDSL
jgi:hypothetical protein